jgi:hypothetical protein
MKNRKDTVVECVIFGILSLIAFLFLHYWIMPKYEIAKKYEAWYYAALVIGLLLSILLVLLGSRKNVDDRVEGKNTGSN